MNKNHGIQADYFYYGIEVGILDFEMAISWAYEVIEKEVQPSGEMVDLALSRSRGRNGALEALKEIRGYRDSQRSGAMLLSTLLEMLENGACLKSIAQKAVYVTWATRLPENIRFEFDIINDEVALADKGIYGNLDLCKSNLEKSLRLHQNKDRI